MWAFPPKTNYPVTPQHTDATATPATSPYPASHTLLQNTLWVTTPLFGNTKELQSYTKESHLIPFTNRL